MGVSQWFALSDIAAKWFADARNDHTKAFGTMWAPDEHYFVVLCIRFGLPWRDIPTMYVEWSRKWIARSPAVLKMVTPDLHDGLLLFARKVTSATVVNISVDGLDDSRTCASKSVGSK